jgi:hypothetical protein
LHIWHLASINMVEILSLYWNRVQNGVEGIHLCHELKVVHPDCIDDHTVVAGDCVAVKVAHRPIDYQTRRLKLAGHMPDTMGL